MLEIFPNNKQARTGLAELRQRANAGAVGRPQGQDAALQTALKQLASLYQQSRFKTVIGEARRLVAKFPIAVLHNMIGASRAGLSDLEGAADAFKKGHRTRSRRR